MTLGNDEVAAVVSYVRNRWGNRGGLVSPGAVTRLRGTPLGGSGSDSSPQEIPGFRQLRTIRLRLLRQHHQIRIVRARLVPGA